MLDKRILSFLGLAFGITWGLVAVGYLLGVRDASHWGYTPVAALGMWGPGLAALIQHRFLDRASWSGLGLSLKGTHWGVVALTALLGLCIVPLYFLVQYLLGHVAGGASFGHVSITTERLIVALEEMLASSGQAQLSDVVTETLYDVSAPLVLLFALGVALIAAFSINLPFMLGEELGWRGYLWQRTRHWSGMRRVGFTGMAWGLWHAPLIAMGHNYPDHRVAGIGMMVLFCLLAALLFDWTRTRSRSIWSACVLHGLINGSAGVSLLFGYGGHPLLASVVGVAGFVTLGLLSLLIVLLDGSYRAGFLKPLPMVPNEAAA